MTPRTESTSSSSVAREYVEGLAFILARDRGASLAMFSVNYSATYCKSSRSRPFFPLTQWVPQEELVPERQLISCSTTIVFVSCTG